MSDLLTCTIIDYIDDVGEVAPRTEHSKEARMNNEMITAEAKNTGFCVVCGESNEDCPKHGPADRDATRLLAEHDRGSHVDCHPKGCALAGTVTSRAAPNWTPSVSAPSSGDAPLPSWAKRTTAADLRGEVPKAKVVPTVDEVVLPAEARKDPSSLTWEEPELPSRFTWLSTVSELKANPGKWAKVVEAPDRAHANRARNALRYHGAATRTKKTGPNGEVTVWASWEPSA